MEGRQEKMDQEEEISAQKAGSEIVREQRMVAAEQLLIKWT